jgi:alkylation response protein AidB-like acyl-CoA dehydrogenase
MKAVEEFAAECSIVKVFGSETLDYVVDEGVQIHGGYGFHQDYAVERAYRDSRINRIFEGTNEINRLLIPGIMLKRAAKGTLPLVAAAQGVLAEVLGGPRSEDSVEGPFSDETRLARNAKKVALLLMGVAYQKFLMAIEQQQEVLAGIADVVMEAYAIESVTLRAGKLAQSGKGASAGDMCRIFVRDAMGRIEMIGRTVLAACSEGDALAVLRRFTKYEPVNSVSLRRQIAGRLLETERYTL